MQKNLGTTGPTSPSGTTSTTEGEAATTATTTPTPAAGNQQQQYEVFSQLMSQVDKTIEFIAIQMLFITKLTI